MSRGPLVLMYPAVARVSEDPNDVCVSSKRFEAQMLCLRHRGLRREVRLGARTRRMLKREIGSL